MWWCRHKSGARHQRRRWSRDIRPEAFLPTRDISWRSDDSVSTADIDVVGVDGTRLCDRCSRQLVGIQRSYVPTTCWRHGPRGAAGGTTSCRWCGTGRRSCRPHDPANRASIAQSIVQRPSLRGPTLTAAAASAAAGGLGRAAGQRNDGLSSADFIVVCDGCSSRRCPSRRRLQLDSRQTSLNSGTCLQQRRRQWRHTARMRRRLPTDRMSGLRRLNNARLWRSSSTEILAAACHFDNVLGDLSCVVKFRFTSVACLWLLHVVPACLSVTSTASDILFASPLTVAMLVKGCL